MAETVTPTTIQEWTDSSYKNSADHGFWDEPDTPATVPMKLMLITSEVSEALESYRDPESDRLIKVPVECVEGLLEGFGQEFDDRLVWLRQIYEKWQQKPKGFDIELADALIRIFDLAGRLDIDLEAALLRKAEYNRGRERMHGRRV